MLTLALAQFRPRKGAYADNLCRLGAVFREAAGWPAPPRLILAPEAALTGYFLEGGVRDLAVPAEKLFDDLARMHLDAAAPPLDVALGFYEVHRNRLYNSALYASLGGSDAGIRHVHRKIFLPTYGVFDEERFVESGRAIEAFDTAWGRAALVVCEDAWHSIVPTIGALDGAQIILVPSASPARGIQPGDGGRPASALRWERLVQGIAEEHGVYVALSQLVGFEGGKGFIGGSLVAGPRGDLIVRGPLFDEALVPATLDFEEITRARADTPLLADLEVKLPHLMGSLHAARRGRAGAGGSGRERAGVDGSRSDVLEGMAMKARPALSRPLPPSPDPLAIDPQLTRQWLVEFIRDEVQRRRGFDKVILGLSGGVDSALVAYLAAEALGPANVLGVRMPYRTSSAESLEHAALVGTSLGITLRTVDISGVVDGLVGAIGEEVSPGRKGNMMARARMIVLFDLSAGHCSLPLGTGNKSERLLGYFTWHADDSPPVNPLGDLFKTQVWALARHMGVPDAIVGKPATADLVHGQTDEGDFGISYHKADGILHWLLLGYRPTEIEPFGYTALEVELVRKRLEGTHWKRRLPTVAMVSPTAIGEFYLRPVDY
ncbi:MAG: NAD+ synthase [Gemmatimonadales bacterium]